MSERTNKKENSLHFLKLLGRHLAKRSLVDLALGVGELQHLFFNGPIHHKPSDVHWTRLSDTVDAVDRLLLNGGTTNMSV